ncbi:MAG: glycosyl transferase [Chloroflexi bacterium RBG_13_56_8]|nr:MAG: glycosyl transferase [Chloroflexi bacterium RBG_13_56_8]
MNTVPTNLSSDGSSLKPSFSVVIPVYNEAKNLVDLYEALQDALGELDEVSEFILVDDGSTDGSYEILKELHQRDPRIRVIRLRRNFGQTAAFAAGFDHARGDVVITMDADLQNDPHDIPMLLETMRNGGFDIVSGWRVNRQDSFLRKFPSRLANWLISRVTGVALHDYGCSLKAYRSEVTQNIRLYGELHRFVPALASWMGVTYTEVPVKHHARVYGKSKYNLSRTTRVLLDLFTVSFLLNYAVKPMQIFGRWGLLSTFIGFAIALYLTLLKIFTETSLADRPLLWLAILLIIVGIQFISMGLLGELVVRTYHETQNKPIYAIREILED